MLYIVMSLEYVSSITCQSVLNFTEFGIPNTRLKRTNTAKELDVNLYQQKLIFLYNQTHRQTDKLSWICKNCICHDLCKGYYYESNPDGDGYDTSLVGVTLSEIGSKIQSLKKACECPQCLHVERRTQT